MTALPRTPSSSPASSSGPSSPPATVLTARSPEDLLAAVPVLLGFEPERSLVLVTFGGRHPFHARIDLPEAAHVDECVRMLVRPATHHGVARVVLVAYDAEAGLAARLARHAAREFAARGIEVLDVLRTSGGHWFRPLGPRPGHGVAYEIGEHRFRVQGVLAGRVVESSRAALATRLDPDAELQRAVSRALRRVVPPSPDGVAELVDGLLGRPPGAGDIARLLLGVLPIEGRDRAWARMSRQSARLHVELWTAVLRGASGQLAAQPAALLAFACWLEGSGALAWCAVDRCLATEPRHRLGQLVAEVLDRAVPPALWEPPGEGGTA